MIPLKLVPHRVNHLSYTNNPEALRTFPWVMSQSRLVLKENGLLYARRINQERSNVKDYPIKGSR